MLAMLKDIYMSWKSKKDVGYCGSNLSFSGWLTGHSYPMDIELTNLTMDLSLKRTSERNVTHDRGYNEYNQDSIYTTQILP